MIQTEDYRFTNDAWARYTGAQILASTFIVFGLAMFVLGWTEALGALDQLIVSTPDGVLIGGEANLGPGLLVGMVGVVIGVHLTTAAARFWPSPTDYALPAEVEGYFAHGGSEL